MEDVLVGPKLAKLAKEAGFDIFQRYYYWEDDPEVCYNENFPDDSCTLETPAPTQSLLQRWLREKHDVEITIKSYSLRKYIFEICIWINGTRHSSNECTFQYRDPFNTYEEALEVGLSNALTLIK